MDKLFLTNIQRGSLHDGPGVRVTYFFQGCNLKCGWCHNPETISIHPKLMIYSEKCVSCKMCADVCTQELSPEKCISCGKCVQVCPSGARIMSSKGYEINELISIALREAPIISPNGGITCSGGEPMLQVDILAELLKAFKQNGIHTAIDTAANVPWKSFEKVLPYTDLFLMDYKHSNDELHKKYTGVSRDLIISNLKKLNTCGKEIWIRMPIIPNVNDTTEHIDKTGKELSEINFTGKIELLPFHRLGSNKYKALQIPYDFKNTVPPKKEILDFFKDQLAAYGLNVKK